MAAAAIDQHTDAAEEETVHVLHRHGGPVRVLDGSVSAADRLAAESDFAEALQESGCIVGLDMEWAPDRCKQHDHEVALVQLAVGSVVWLVRTCQISLPEFVRSIFLDPRVVKVVVDFDGADRAKLARSFGIRIEGDPAAVGFLDISSMAADCGATGRGLKRLALRCGHHVKKEKSVSTSNWEARVLSEAQRQYAADDAFFSLLVAGDLMGEHRAHAAPADPVHAELRQRARQAWAQAEARVRGARRSEDCSERDGALEALSEALHGIVSGAARETGLAKVPLDEVLRRARLRPELRGLASRHGIVLGKAFFQEQKGFFAVSSSKSGGQPRIEACGAAERVPPTEAELALPWEKDPAGALQLWEAAERERASSGKGCHGDGGPSIAQLRRRLAQVGRSLEARGSHAATKSVTELLNGKLLREQGQGSAAPSRGVGPKKRVSGSGLETVAATAGPINDVGPMTPAIGCGPDDVAPTAGPSRCVGPEKPVGGSRAETVATAVGTDAGAHGLSTAGVDGVGGLPNGWAGATPQAAASGSLGEGGPEGAVVRRGAAGPRKGRRRYRPLAFPEPAAAQGFLESASA